MIAKFSFLAGALLLGGGLFVLLHRLGTFSVAETRGLIGVSLLVWGVYFLQLSNTQHLRSRVDALEKGLAKPDSNRT